MAPYTSPGLMVDIGGRRIHLYCTGAGARTVVLMAGLSSWSPVWYLVQPEIAKNARVCAFDRASYGYSDAAPRPPTVTDTVSDLHAALQGAHLPPPYVLVGHSLGGLEARLFAERWPDEVAGMVLVDSSPAGELLTRLNYPGSDDAFVFERMVSHSLHCASLAAKGPLESSHPEYRACSLPLPDDTPAAFRNIWPRFFTADHAVAQVSLISSLLTHGHDSADRVSLGDKPLVVLSASDWGPETTAAGRFWRNFTAVWYPWHEAFARLSSRGVHRIVEGAGHEIQLDKPQAVIDAVDEVLRALPPAPNS